MLKNIKVLFNGIQPQVSTGKSCGLDMFYDGGDIVLKPGEVLVHSTKIMFDVPSGYFITFESRSSLFRDGILIQGIIDSDFKNETSFIIRNISNLDIQIKNGMKMGQAILIKHFNWPKKFILKNKRLSGLGSTGK